MKKTPQYNTVLFSEVWEDADEFYSEAADAGIPLLITQANTKTLFYLLFARYGNNPIANNDINQFKYKVFSIIFQYGPTWEKRMDIQTKLRSLTEADIAVGSKSINNRAMNPSADPSTGSEQELQYINEQNTIGYKKGKVEAYASLWEMLRTDVTENFLREFLKCFKLSLRPENPLLYVTEEEEDED